MSTDYLQVVSGPSLSDQPMTQICHDDAMNDVVLLRAILVRCICHGKGLFRASFGSNSDDSTGKAGLGKKKTLLSASNLLAWRMNDLEWFTSNLQYHAFYATTPVHDTMTCTMYWVQLRVLQSSKFTFQSSFVHLVKYHTFVCQLLLLHTLVAWLACFPPTVW